MKKSLRQKLIGCLVKVRQSKGSYASPNTRRTHRQTNRRP